MPCLPDPSWPDLVFRQGFRRVPTWDPEQPVYGLEPPGLDGHVAPHRTVEALAAHFLPHLRALWPEGPYVLAGHSFGGRIALELSQQLMALGAEVKAVLLIDCSPPFQALDEAAPPTPLQILRDLVSILEVTHGACYDLPWDDLVPYGPEEQVERLTQLLISGGAFPEGTSSRILRGWQAVYTANYAMARAYQPKPLLPVPLCYFRAEEHPAEVGDAREEGWRLLSPPGRPMETVRVPGTHLGMMRPPNLDVLAQRLQEQLRQL